MGVRFQGEEVMPRAGEDEWHTRSPFLGSEGEEEGQKGDISIGGKRGNIGAHGRGLFRPGRAGATLGKARRELRAWQRTGSGAAAGHRGTATAGDRRG
jgi:hypothetical protein